MLRILAATDFSSRSERALRRAGLLARQHQAELILLHVVDDDQPDLQVESDKKSSEEFLKQQAKTLPELQALECRFVVTAADPFDGIVRTAESEAADLIVMGAHRKQLLRDVFIGTTIERVIRTGSLPVLMVNRAPTHRYRGAVAAVDMSEPSARALRIGSELGLLDGVNVTAVHAFVALAKGPMYIGGASRREIEKHVLNEQAKLQTELRSFLAAINVPAKLTYRAGEGTPYEVISAVAKDLRTDLAIIGTHGRTGIVRVLLGSVAEQILNKLNIDILVVPPARAS